MAIKQLDMELPRRTLLMPESRQRQTHIMQTRIGGLHDGATYCAYAAL